MNNNTDTDVKNLKVVCWVLAILLVICFVSYSNKSSLAADLQNENDELSSQLEYAQTEVATRENLIDEANGTIDELNNCMDNIVSDASFDNSYSGLWSAIESNTCSGSHTIY